MALGRTNFLDDHTWMAVPLRVSDDAATGPVSWTIAGAEEDWSGTLEVRLAEGEQEIVAGNQDPVETRKQLPPRRRIFSRSRG